MTLQTLPALLLFLLPLAYSPGPGNLFFAANGARFGFRGTVAANLGYHAATFAVTFALGLGFAQALSNLAGLHTAIRIVGAGHVFWLALGFLRAVVAPLGPTARAVGFRDGAVLLILNPKAYVIIALMFSQFLPPSGSNAATIATISVLFTLNNCLAFSLYALAGDRIATSLRQPAHTRILNLVFCIFLVLTATWMLLIF